MHAFFRAPQRLLALWLALAWLLPLHAGASGETTWSTLAFEIVDASGKPIPGRLTLVREDDPSATVPLRPVGDASQLVIRPNTVASLRGRGQVRLPAGRYRSYASRGLEWSVDTGSLEAQPGTPTRVRATLRHEIDTRGWTSADLHVHTKPYSNHGDARLPERIVTLVAEGIEFAVATDHNHHTDWGPALKQAGAEPFLLTVSGNEISSTWGHLNVLPVDKEREPASPDEEARRLLPQLRQRTGEDPIPILIQVNHPRSGVAAYFTQNRLDPVTASPGDPRYDPGFDALEVFNGKEATGYPPARGSDAAFTPSVLGDWYNLLNRGHRYVAVGNSDSHSVAEDPVGYPRNFIRTPDDAALRPSAAQILSSLRNRRSFTTLGPFVSFSVNGHEMGSEFTSQSGQVDMAIRVQAASWIDVDRVRLVVNGDVIEDIPVPDERDPVRLDVHRTVRLKGDSWIALQVEGDEALSPIVPDGERPTRPLAVTNPVWVHVGQPGDWISPWQQALDWIAAGQKPVAGARPPNAPASKRALRRLAAAELRAPGAAEWVTTGLADSDPKVRLAAARAAQSLALPRLIPVLDQALLDAPSAYERVAILRAIGATDADLYRRRVLAKARVSGTAGLREWGAELGGLSPETNVQKWAVTGAYRRGPRAPRLSALAETLLPGQDDPRFSWRERLPQADGYVDLLGDVAPANRAQNSVSYARVYLFAQTARRVPVALGSDDGIQVYVGDKRVFADATTHRATPWQHFLELPLEPGWNRVTLAVTNNVGDSGFYFQLLDDDVETSIAPD